ncbi:potassium channel family protein [Edaphobacter aggregans]|uniref:ion channel n=1 Tax=Edaphobacter aggregans TaxID=570835 RepID=UPI00068C1A89
MSFVHQAYITTFLVTLTVILQSVGMSSLIHWTKVRFPQGVHQLGLFRSFVLMVRFTSLLVCLHMLEILLWASFYRWKCFPTWEVAFYFSVGNYATVGAGNVSLQPIWRLMGPVESITGVLMCGLSASFLFAIVTRLVQLREPKLVDPPRWASQPPEVRSQPTDCVDPILPN